jgi:predicted ATP-grasp superfamily ATP-dependent carboligase
MEVNGRFWGSLQLAVDAGVDFPWLAYQVATKVTPQTTHTYRQGARLHWILGDLDNLLIQLRDRDVRRSTTSKLLAITNFLGTCIDPKARAEIFRLSDPMPGILEVITWAKSIMRS